MFVLKKIFNIFIIYIGFFSKVLEVVIYLDFFFEVFYIILLEDYNYLDWELVFYLIVVICKIFGSI